MKTLAVADAFMKREYYENCFVRFPEYELIDIIHFGTQDRKSMRDPIHLIERQGPDAVEPPKELFDKIADCEVLMVHLCPVPRKLIEKGKNLKFILLNRGGTENVDLQAAADHGIVVLNNPAHNANSVAELTLGLMLAETRNIARTHANLMNGIWKELYSNAGRVYELRNRTVGIIGFGNIGRRVARKLNAFDCKLLVYDKYVSSDDPDLKKYDCEFVSLKELMNRSDIVTLHVRSNDLVLGKAELNMMKEGAYFINSARPHLIDNDALYEMLKSGYLAGAAFDVFMQEPTDINEPYIKLDNVTMCNHRGGDTVNCYSDSPAMLLEQTNVYREGNHPRFFANEAMLMKTCSD